MSFRWWRVLRSHLALLLLLLTMLWFVLTQPFATTEKSRFNIAASPQRLEADVRYLADPAPPIRLTAPQLEMVATWIESEFQQWGPTRRQTYTANGSSYSNVILELGPGHADASSELIVIGAHYDSWDGLPGADDNASGVAGVLELARLLSTADLAGPVQLVAWPLEEPPWFRGDDMGSYRHAQALSVAGRKLKFMVSVEMIGYFSSVEGSQHYSIPGLGLIYPDTGNFIAVVGSLGEMSLVRQFKHAFSSASELPIHSFNAPASLHGVDFSDHLSFWRFGYPALMLTDTSFNRNLAYHTMDDTADRLDYDSMAAVIDGVYQVVVDLTAIQ